MIPNWQEYFITLAFVISLRSKDAQTKHGCVITDRKNHIIGTGYNSPPPGLPDDLIPNTRPEKYLYYRHSEENAQLNCMINPWTIEGGAIAYTTGKPCFGCTQRLWSGNVREVYYITRGWMKDEEEAEKVATFLEWTKMKIEKVSVDVDKILSGLRSN